MLKFIKFTADRKTFFQQEFELSNKEVPENDKITKIQLSQSLECNKTKNSPKHQKHQNSQLSDLVVLSDIDRLQDFVKIPKILKIPKIQN